MVDITTLAATEAVTEAATEKGDKLSIGEAAVTAIFGYSVVFAGLLVLMIVLYCTGAYFKSKEAKQKAESAAEKTAAPAAAPAPAAAQKLAPGSAGHVKLFDVPDKEAAMIMAIVADKMQKPLNELHFISIKEVK
ncbi:OadG family protein [uncultured Ruminococcus sp.]|uniref:OadG family protein n=1 Tax=uncultured Ruminococcus sp. TaxID=165186 RepID=UPI0026336586|nr:OadG family protein [uncultured Ruminococcus sp.]